MGSNDDEMKQVFVEESLDHLSSIETDLLLMEEGGDVIDEELVNKVFRTVHSIKGGAGFLGLTKIKSLSHEMETVLGNIRSRQLVPNAEVIHFLLLASDALEYMILDMDQSEEIDISQHLEALKSLGRGESMESSASLDDMPASREEEKKNPGEAVAEKKDPAVGDIGENPPFPETVQVTTDQGTVLFSLEGQCLSNARSENKALFFIEIPLDSQCAENPDAAAERISKGIQVYGTVIESRMESHYVSRGHHAPEGPFFLVVFASVLALDDIRLLFEVDPGSVFQIMETGELLPSDELVLASGKSMDCDETGGGEGLSKGKMGRGEGKNSHTGKDNSLENTCLDTVFSQGGDSIPVSDADMEQSRSRRIKGMGTVETSLRVDLKLLDSLMTLAGELVLSRNQLLQAVSGRDTHATEIVSQRIDLITSELQQTVMSTRMQHIAKVFDRFPRLVRDLAGHLGKEVRLTMQGREVELDKTLLEAVTDPLIHLVRNAIDHGVESPEVRRVHGKPATGQIFLKAFHEAGKVNIDVSDDGRGLDGDQLVERAVELGIITMERGRVMSEKEKLHLIFLPGFSMASQVTDLSGRGVGMDVVKNNMKCIGGQVDIESQPGIGTRFQIRVPLTLAIIPSQVVVAEGERYAIPQLNLEELVRIPANRVQEKIEYVGDAQVVRLREALLPLVRLADIIGVSRTYLCSETGERKRDLRENIADRRSPRRNFFQEHYECTERQEMAPALKTEPSASDTRPVVRGVDRRYRAASALNITVLSTGNLKYGLIVDELHDSEEIVVKPLGRHLQQCRAYAGATIMGDGRVALILDVANLAEMAGVMAVVEKDFSSVVGQTRETVSNGHQKKLSLFTFMGGEADLFAVPLDQVVRIEKIASEKIEIIGKMQVVQSRGKTLPLFTMDEVIDTAPLPPSAHFLVIVFEVNGREWGLLGAGPVDGVEISGTIDEKTLKQPGISGSVSIEGRTTMVVNISEMIAVLQPRWLPSQAPSMAPVPELPTILIAEDSEFFRNQIKRYIEQEGYHVMAAEDGQIALDLIKAHVDTLSLVVTDLEMPNLDGFGLTEKIKTNPRYAHLPVIALSTLADDRNMAKGNAVGVDDYQLKLDREMLLKSIKNQIQRSQVKK